MRGSISGRVARVRDERRTRRRVTLCAALYACRLAHCAAERTWQRGRPRDGNVNHWRSVAVAFLMRCRYPTAQILLANAGGTMESLDRLHSTRTHATERAEAGNLQAADLPALPQYRA